MFIDTHIRPKLGDIKLNQLQTMDIQRLYNELREQLGSYLAAADKRGLLPLFFLELTTGLRKGELVPLLWSDVDEKNIKCPPDTFCTSFRTGAGLSNPIQRIKRTPSERMGFFLWQNYYKLIQCTALRRNAPSAFNITE